MAFLCITCLRCGNPCNLEGHKNFLVSHKWAWPKTTASNSKWLKALREYPFTNMTEDVKLEIEKTIRNRK